MEERVSGRAQSGVTDLVERGAALRLLDRALSAARAGSGGAVLLEGEPGIGKTALLARLRGCAVATLHARASPLEREFGFAIVRQLFEARLVAASGDERAMLLAGPAAPAAALFDARAAAPAADYELLSGLHWLCANVAGGEPLLVVVDDLQWVD
jgi:predicted ATPase